jgi:hypothetical protein
VDVRRDVGRIIQRACAHEPHAGSTVLAEDCDLAARAAEDSLRAAIVTRHVDWLRSNREDVNALCLDQQIDDERAAGLALTVEAMAAMDEQWL